jgi:hypothetical protein
MQYLLLIYTPEAVENAMSPAEQETYMNGYWVFSQEVVDKKMHVAGEALQPVATATSVRVRDGKTVITDGPFAETKEQLGGFYLLECTNLDQAIEMAAKIPGAVHGTIEIRPIIVFGDPPASLQN